MGDQRKGNGVNGRDRRDADTGRGGIWIAAAVVLLVVSLYSNLSPAIAVLFNTGPVRIGWPWAVLPVLVAHLIAHRLRPAWRRVCEGVAWVAWWVALPVVLSDLFGMASARNASWLVLVGAAEVAAAVWIYRLLRNWEMRRRDPARVSLGRTPGWFGDRLWLGGEDRFLHLEVLGPTGSGKTRWVLSPLWLQDAAAGRGVTLIDPKGDFAAFALAQLRRLGRPYALLRPGDPESARINPLDADPSEAAETVVYALDRAFPDGHPFYRPLGQNLLRYSVRALVEVRPGSGLDDLRRFLLDDDFRIEILTRTEDASVRSYFRDVFAAWPSRTRAEYTAGVVNTLLALLGTPEVAQLFAPPGTLDLDALLRDGGALVVDLPVGRLGATAGLAGAFVLAALQRAALKRADGGAGHIVYVDEFGTFAPGGFAEFLALARSKRVGAVLAHQHLAQLPPGLRAAVEANVRSRIVLGGIAADDADSIARLAVDPEGGQRRFAQHLRALPRGEAYAILTVKGALVPPRRIVLPQSGDPPASVRSRAKVAAADA